MSVEEFFQDFTQEIIAQAGAEANFYESIFFEKMSDFLVEQAIISSYTSASFKKANKSIKVDGWELNEENGTITLLVADYKFDGSMLRMSQTEVKKLLGQCKKFFTECLKANFCFSLEESSPVYDLANTIFTKKEFIHKVNIILITNGILSKNITKIDETEEKGYLITYDVWDIDRYFKIESSGKGREDIEVDFCQYTPEGLKCLKAFSGSEDCESYLLAIPANILSNLYDIYGERLLEQNVRTFLQFRGNVNKGIRNTILNEPDMFFAYNNGLTTTAEYVQTNAEGSHIIALKNFQIVNGGQTTAAIFTASKTNKADIDKVFVQVKLTVISSAKIEEVVPNISQYANTQNKVSAADFFSNHPFHLRIQDFSRRIWAPSTDGGIKETHWFYERSRGQFVNAQSLKTQSEKKEFLLKYPKAQMFTKTDLAKYINTFDGLPFIVSKGAQKNFAIFASKIGKEWESNEQKFNELFFRELIAKAISFRTLDKAVLKAPWYGQGYKANIVTYTLAKLADMVSAKKMKINFEQIWKKQKLPSIFLEQLLQLGEIINHRIKEDPPEGTNITEWCKKEIAWQRIQQLPIEFIDGFAQECLIGATEYREKAKEAIKEQIMTNGINLQVEVVNKGAHYWQALFNWALKNKCLSPKEINILKNATVKGNLLSEKQSEILLRATQRAINEGFFYKQ